jgi:hypothetical protein
MKFPAWQALALALVTTALTGCSANYSAAVDISLPPAGDRATVVEKIPLAVGVFYSPEFRHYRYTWNRCQELAQRPGRTAQGCDLDLHIDINNLGQASVALVDRALWAMFERVETLDVRLPAPGAAPALAGVVEPEMIDPVYTLRGGTVRFAYGAVIGYRLVLRSPAGEELARWSVSGETRQQIEGAAFVTTGVREATHRALRSAEANMLIGFREQPEVKRWLAHHGAAAAGATGVSR